MNQFQLAKEFIERSKNVFIYPSIKSQDENLSSALALFYTLKKLGKDVNVLAKEIPPRLQFLTFPFRRQFTISINASKKKISEMHYEKNGESLKIHLSLPEGELTEEDITLSAQRSSNGLEEEIKEKFNSEPDLLITLGVASLEELAADYGKIRELNGVPIINIDTQESNEGFGKVNLVEPHYLLAEIITEVLGIISEDIIDRDIASCLLTSLILKSQDFCHSCVSPKTFEAAALLTSKGGDYQQIAHRLCHKEGETAIRLLGRALKRLCFREKEGIYTTFVDPQDFRDIRASSQDLVFVIERLKRNIFPTSSFLLLWKTHSSPAFIQGFIWSEKEKFREEVVKSFSGQVKNRGVLFSVAKQDIKLAQEEVLNVLR